MTRRPSGDTVRLFYGLTMIQGARANLLFDRLIRAEVSFLGRRESAFLAWGKVGLALSVALGIVLTYYNGLSLPVILLLSCTSVAALLAQTMVMKILTGEEELVYYRHEVAIIVVAALTLWLLDQPVWPYLDITILAVGLFLACGRVGCLMVGCCHGRPYAFGPKYSSAHAAAGFTRHYVGIRLFPIQIVESVWVLATVVVGVAMILRGSAPGEAFAWYVIVYDIGRFTFEFVRGDPDRPYIRGFSEAQWTSVLLMVVIVVAEAYGVLPYHAWHWGATVALVAVAIGIAWSRMASGLPRYRLLHPRHVREVAMALEGTDRLTPDPSPEGTLVLVATTSLGLQLSAGTTPSGSGVVQHYTISCSEGVISSEAARTLAALIQQLRRLPVSPQVTQGPSGAFHVLFHSAENTPV